MAPARPVRRWIQAGLLAAAVAGCTPAPAPGAGAAAASPAAAREIGYGTVADAHAALSARGDVAHSVRGTYEVFVDERAHAVWLFTLPGSAAYPALVRRQLIGRDGSVTMRSFVFCEAGRGVCNLLQENARLMDAEIVERLGHPSRGAPGGGPGDRAAPEPDGVPERMPDVPGLRV